MNVLRPVLQKQRVTRHSYHGQRLLPALVETTGQHAYFSVEKYCWRLFNLASLNINEKVKFAKFAKYKGTLNIRDLQYLKIVERLLKTYWRNLRCKS